MKIVHFSYKDLTSLYGYYDDDKKGIWLISKGKISKELIPVEEVKILPVTVPTKIIGIGLNYKDHAMEMDLELPDEPLIFMKPSTAVIAHKEKIVLPEISKRVDYEGELAVIIGKKCKNISEDEAEEYILGYTCFNDVTARDLQAKDVQYTRSKSFDTFAPIGPWAENEIDPLNLEIKTYVNDRMVQHSNTNMMKFNVYQLVSYISKIMTLLPGDVIATGTPAGVGPLMHGDTVKVEIEGIGILENYVVKEKNNE